MTDERAILRWTGHPLIDAGVAALTAFADKRDPAEVTAGDLAEYARFAERHYLGSDMSKTVGILFTMNSFLNPTMKPEQKLERIRTATRAYAAHGDAGLGMCAFCGRAAIRVLHRDDIPMIAGRTVVNFYPGGAPGLPICGVCQAALHGLTVGAPRISGKALVLYADDREFLLEIVREWVRQVRKYVQLAEAAGAPAIKNPRTRIIETLLKVQDASADDERSPGLVAYHISNSGQGPGIDILPLPSTVVRFVQRARRTRYRQAWQAIERRGWQRIGKKGQSAADLGEDERGEYRNYLYEDLFRLPEESRRFIRIYFLRSPAGLVRRRDEDPRADYRTAAELDVISWELTDLFLKEVVGMDQARIDAIRTLGDRLAEEIDADNNRRLLGGAYRARDYGTVRQLLLRANLARLNRRTAPVIGFDEFLIAFEEGEELARVDWRLAWDLVLIRVIEELHRRGKADLVRESVSPEEGEESTEPEAAIAG